MPSPAVLRWPVLADPCSGLRVPEDGVVAMADPLLRTASFARGHRPDTVLRLGRPWASKTVESYLSDAARTGARVVVVDRNGSFRDPERVAAAFLRCDPTELCRDLLEWTGRGRRRPGPIHHVEAEWWEDWVSADARAIGALAESVPEGLDEPTLAVSALRRSSRRGDLGGRLLDAGP